MKTGVGTHVLRSASMQDASHSNVETVPSIVEKPLCSAYRGGTTPKRKGRKLGRTRYYLWAPLLPVTRYPVLSFEPLTDIMNFTGANDPRNLMLQNAPFAVPKQEESAPVARACARDEG
jgi:hypothetical protein